MPIVCLIVFHFSNAIHACCCMQCKCKYKHSILSYNNSFHSYDARADRHQTHIPNDFHSFNWKFWYETTKHHKIYVCCCWENIKDFSCIYQLYARTQITLNICKLWLPKVFFPFFFTFVIFLDSLRMNYKKKITKKNSGCHSGTLMNMKCKRENKKKNPDWLRIVKKRKKNKIKWTKRGFLCKVRESTTDFQ